MKLALIPPISLLEHTEETEFQLMLPQLVYNSQYNYAYKKHCDDPNKFVILDNGANENALVSIQELLQIANAYGVDEVVIPDAIKDAEYTKMIAKDFIDRVSGTPDHEKFQFMFVAQGTNMKEFLGSIEFALREPLISTIGIPRHSCATLGDEMARHELAAFIYRHDTDNKAVHLLGGVPHYPTEIREFGWTPNVRSHDTSSPFNFAFLGKKLRKNGHVSRPDDYFYREAEDFDSKLVRYNIDALRQWTGE